MYALLAAVLLPMNGDAIGPNPSLTNGTGGFSGRPAAAVHAAHPREVRRIDAVLFGDFNPALAGLEVWPLAEYLADKPAPLLPPITKWQAAAWGNSGVAGGNLPTKLVSLETRIDLERGDYVVAVRLPPGAKMAGSRATETPDPYFERPGQVRRAPLPESSGVAWAMSVYAPPPDGDFNLDGLVDDRDYSVWYRGFGSQYNGLDLLAWQRGGWAAVGVDPIPEPLAWMTAWIGICFALSWGDRNGALRR